MQSVSALRLKNCREWQRNIALPGLFAGIFSALVGTLTTLIFRSKFASVLHIQPWIFVGYYTTEMNSGTTIMSGVPFCNVTGGDLSIQDIKALDDGAVAADGGYYMKWYDNGKYAEAYWTSPLNDGTDGWGDDKYEAIKKSFAAGEWFIIAPYVEKPTTQVAGALVSADTKSPTYTITLPAETTTATGNPFPTECDIQTIIGMDGEDIAADGGFYMKWYDDGKYAEAYWTSPLNDGTDGWGDDHYDAIKKTFLPGQGFLVAPYVTKPSLKVPNPLYTDK